MNGCRVDAEPHLRLSIHVLHVDLEEVSAGRGKGEIPWIPRWNVLEINKNTRMTNSIHHSELH